MKCFYENYFSNFFIILFIFINVDLQTEQSITIPSIPSQHVVCWLRSLSKTDRHKILDLCRSDSNSILVDNEIVDDNFKTTLCSEIIHILKNYKEIPCWGYEIESHEDKCLLYKPICDRPSYSWASNQKEQLQIFFTSADFGYVKLQKDELKYYCLPNTSSTESSQLKCSKYIRFCEARNIYIDFKNLVHLKEPIRYREDILNYGDIGGWNCDLSRKELLNEGGHKSPLMSWFTEISNFKTLRNKSNKKCDMIIEKPTFIMKLDATINMYHHFCDFMNLYLSFHINGSFYLDNQILIWDTHPYRSNFGPIWKAFTKNELLNLSQFKGKIVCFKNVIFPLLPRMIYGFYYNMPLIPGCSNSGVFRAFNRHLLFHFNLSDSDSLSSDVDIIKITFLKRNTKYRQILNQKELVESLKDVLMSKNQTSKVKIRFVDFNHQMPFMDQVRISSNSDILIGIHGAGLTHTLFQPDYGLLFELYNCEDHDCYKDLARLRGVHYLTWRDQSKLKIVVDESQKADQISTGAAHAKFANYYFDPDEFVKLSWEAIEIVRMRKKSFNRRKNELMNFNDNSNDDNNKIQNEKFLSKDEL